METRKRPIFVLISLFTISLLTACGGGGGGGSGSDDQPDDPPANNAPSISGTPTDAIRSGKAYTFVPTASDPDGDSLTFSIENQPPWLQFNANTGELSGTPVLSDLGPYADIAITVSDGEDSAQLAPFQIAVISPKLNENDFSTQGVTTPIDTGDPDTTGFINDGALEVNFGERMQRFENSTLELEFDSDGNLLDLSGETEVPVNLSDNVTLANTTRARVGMLTGAAINADPNFGITLKDDFTYFVYYIGTSTELTIGDPDDPSITESLTLDLPLSGEIVFISDPFDPFFYHFASVPFVGERGQGSSEQGFIPFVPIEDFDQLDAFDGHSLEKGSYSIGFKVFDFFNLDGTMVVYSPSFIEQVDWENPLDSAIQYSGGINGDASFAFAILSVGIFDFSLASTSATLDVGTDRQHVAMQTTIAPDVSWQPSWFPILPTTEVVGNWSIDGSGEFSALLSGSYQSTIPAASISGVMRLDNDGVTLDSEIPHDDFPLTLSMVFQNNTVSTEILTPDININGEIEAAANQGFDLAVQEYNQTVEDVEDAIDAYDLAFSLDGLRGQLPAIADQAISTLNGIPQTAYDRTYSSVLSGFRNSCRTYLGVTKCASDFVDEVDRAGSAARTARNRANNAIVPYIDRLNTLKNNANEVRDGDAFRAALKNILLEVIANRQLAFSYTFSQTVTIDFVVTSFNVTVTRTYSNTFTVINSANTATLQTAADNVDDIDPAYTVMIDTQAILDNLPSEDDVEQARQEMNDGLVDLPTFGGAGYTVSGGVVTTYLILDDENVEVLGNVNPLDPDSLFAAIGEAVAKGLLQ